MSRCPTFTFDVSIMSKWLAKHISTKVSFKNTITERHVYIDIRWPWKWNQYFFFEIWIDDRTKMILLSSFQLATPLNSQNTIETEIINNSGTLIFIWKLVFPIGIIQASNPLKWRLWLYFSSLYDYFLPTTWHSLVHTSWC